MASASSIGFSQGAGLGGVICCGGSDGSIARRQRFGGPIAPRQRFGGPIAPRRRFGGPIARRLRFGGSVAPRQRFCGSIARRQRFSGSIAPRQRFGGFVAISMPRQDPGGSFEFGADCYRIRDAAAIRESGSAISSAPGVGTPGTSLDDGILEPVRTVR